MGVQFKLYHTKYRTLLFLSGENVRAKLSIDLRYIGV